MEIGRLVSQILRNKRRLLSVVLLYVLALVLAYPLLRRIGEVLRDHKPGLWGMQSWYALLIVGYVVFVLALCVAAVSFALRKTFLWRQWAGLLIGLTLTRGLLYSSITPPWQAPDEHAHFEYAALMGELRRVPTREDISQDLQKRIVKSMFDYDFWRLIQREPVESPPVGFLNQDGMTDVPSTNVVDNRFLYHPQIGSDPPFYYIFPAVLYTLVSRVDVTLQLYVMRLTGVLMLVALVGGAAWAAARLFPRDRALAVSAVLLVVFHPMVAHIGSVLNNDVLAAVFTTALLGLLVVAIREGLRWYSAAGVVALVSLAILTRHSTVIWVIPLLIAIGLVWLWRLGGWPKYAVLAGCGACILIGGLLMAWPSEEVRYWDVASAAWGATVGRVASDGQYALRVVGRDSESWLAQRLSPQTTLDLRGREATITAKVRGESDSQGGAIVIVDRDHGTEFTSVVVATSAWETSELRFTVPPNAVNLELRLVAQPHVTLYFDDVKATDTSGTEVAWLDNGSGEGIYSLGEVIATRVAARLGRGRFVPQLLRVWQRNLQALVANPFPLRLAYETFWGNFGAAMVVPLPRAAYRGITLASIVSIIGLMCGAFRSALGKSESREAWRRSSLYVIVGALLLAVLVVFAPVVASYGRWSPQGRYLFPVIWPVAILLSVGWAALWPRQQRAWLPLSLLVGLFVLDYTALSTIAGYFYAFN